jgi:hypothetical protein
MGQEIIDLGTVPVKPEWHIYNPGVPEGKYMVYKCPECESMLKINMDTGDVHIENPTKYGHTRFPSKNEPLLEETNEFAGQEMGKGYS